MTTKSSGFSLIELLKEAGAPFYIPKAALGPPCAAEALDIAWDTGHYELKLMHRDGDRRLEVGR